MSYKCIKNYDNCPCVENSMKLFNQNKLTKIIQDLNNSRIVTQSESLNISETTVSDESRPHEDSQVIEILQML